MKVALSAIWLGIAASIALMLVATTGVIPAVAGALIQELVDLAAILFALRALKGPALDLDDTGTGTASSSGQATPAVELGAADPA
jgi:hypothetical protein